MTTIISGTDGVDKVKDINAVSFLPFTKEYVSPELPIVAGGSISLNHGLGVTPKLLFRTLVCKTAEYGYSIGDTIDFPGTQDAATAYGLVLVPNSTNIFGRYGSIDNAIYILNKTTGGGPNGITLANWRLIVRAWA